MDQREDPEAQGLTDEEMGALAAHYVQALEPPSGGEPKPHDAAVIARRLAQAFAPAGAAAPADRRLEAAREAARLLEAGGDPGGIGAVLRPAFAPDPQPQPRAIGAFWSMPEPLPVLWRDSESGEDEERAGALGAGSRGNRGAGRGRRMREIRGSAGAGGGRCGRGAAGVRLGLRAPRAGRWGGCVQLRGFAGADRAPAEARRLAGRPGAAGGRAGRCRCFRWVRIRSGRGSTRGRSSGTPSGRRCGTRGLRWWCWTRARKAMGGVADYSPGPVISFYQALEREAQGGRLRRAIGRSRHEGRAKRRRPGRRRDRGLAPVA